METFLDMLQALLKGRTLPKGAASGLIEFRVAAIGDPTAYLELSPTKCKVAKGNPPSPAALSVWSTDQGFEDLAGDYVARAPLHVDGDRGLLKSLAKTIEGSGSLLAIRLQAARSSPAE
jgi:hypothetical protein